MDKPSAVGQPTKPTQPFILLWSINESNTAIRWLLSLDSGGAVWWTLTR